MSSGPLRQVIGAVGLLGLLPTAWLLAAGALTPVQAAVRAVVTLLGVIVVGRVVAWWLSSIARNLERHADTSDDDRPRRRRTDGPVAAAGTRGSAQDRRPNAASDDAQRAGSSPAADSAPREAASADAAPGTA